MVASVGGKVVTDKCWQILVGDNILQARNVQPSCALENILIGPGRMLPGNPIGKHIVPSVEEKSETEKCWVLVGSRIAEDIHVAGVRWFHDMGCGKVVEGNPLGIVRRITIVGHSESPVGITPHEGDPGLGGRVNEAPVDPSCHVVLLLPENISNLTKFQIELKNTSACFI